MLNDNGQMKGLTDEERAIADGFLERSTAASLGMGKAYRAPQWLLEQYGIKVPGQE